MWVGTDTTGNPQVETYNMNYDTRQSARLQEAQSLYNWNSMLYQNWYNSPEQQVQRLEQAGLNPLYFLGGNAGTQAAASSQSGLNQGSGKDSRLDQLNNVVGTTAESLTNSANVILQQQKQAQDYDIARREQAVRSREVGVREREIALQERGGADPDINLKNTQAGYYKSAASELDSRNRLNDAQIDRLAVENGWTQQQIAESQSRQAQINADIDRTYALIKVYASEIGKNNADAFLAIAHGRYFNETKGPYIDKLKMETGLTEQMIYTEREKLANFMADTALKEVQIEVQEGQKIVLQRTAEGIEIKNALDEKYGGWERTQQIVGGYIHSVCEGVNTAINVRTGGAAAALSEAKKGVLSESTQSKGTFADLYNDMMDKIEKADWYDESDNSPEAKAARAAANKATRDFHQYEAKYRRVGNNSASNPTFTMDY